MKKQLSKLTKLLRCNSFDNKAISAKCHVISIITRICPLNESAQESITVGCVPPTLHHTGGLPDRAIPQRPPSLLGRDPLERDSPGQRPPNLCNSMQTLA